MRTPVSFSFVAIFVAALLIGFTDSSQSQDIQTFGQGSQSPPCGRGKQANRFVIFDNGASVCDNASGLVWERAPVGALRTFANATAYCSAKGTGWRIPDIKDFSQWLTTPMRIRPYQAVIRSTFPGTASTGHGLRRSHLPTKCGRSSSTLAEHFLGVRAAPRITSGVFATDSPSASGGE